MKTKLWLYPALTLIVFLLLTALATALLHPTGRTRWLLVSGLSFLGMVAAAMVYAYLKSKAKPGAAAPADDAIDAAASAAHSRLSRTGSPARMPTILVLGPTGSAKTTIIAESGLEPELVAGEMRRAGAIIPTAATNVWFAQGTVFVEAGGTLVNEPDRWLRLIRHFRPSQLSAAVGRGKQAPRAALVCFPCDELIRAGAAQSAVGLAQALRTRLLEVAEAYGVQLPVYVLFTRADRFPHFTEYVRSLSRPEAQEVLGTTLPAQRPVPAAMHAEREAARLTEAFRALIRPLALRRPDLLARESEELVRDSAYEFPREIRKASDVAIQVLVEIARPTHIGVSPFLRGFYFTGVRPIVVEDAGAPAPAAPAPGAASSLDATSVFDARALQGAQARAAATPRGSRRIPEWVFLKRLFPEVVLADRAAMAATGGGTRVDGLRRAALATAAVLCLIAAVGFTTSYIKNHRLERATINGLTQVQALDAAAIAAPSADALRRLDSVRVVAVRVREYERTHPPMSMRWGLYSGEAIFPDLRRAYFRVFDRLLWRNSRTSLLADLRALPDTPNAASAYGPTYDALKAHLVTTSHPEASTAAFLAPVLMRFWHPDGGPDPARSEVARRQFEFFGAELPFGNPYSDAPDAAVVAQAQRFLQNFGDVQRLYAALIAEASERAPAIQFSQLAPTAAPVVRDDYVVPGAFTKQGYAYVQARLRDVNKLFERESWVVGPAAVAPGDRARIAAQMTLQYEADYVRNWQEYLGKATVGGLGGPEETSRTLLRLADNQSPMLQLLAIASRNTAVDTGTIGKAFQPVHAVVPPNATDKLVVDGNMPWVKALSMLQSAVSQVAMAQGPGRMAAMAQVAPAADQATGAVLQISQSFSVSGQAAATGAQVQRLLQAPIRAAGGSLAGLPAADLNGKGQAFCGQVSRVLAKYPFNPRASNDATMDEVAQGFQPGNNAFASFFDAGLQDVMVRQGNSYAAKVGSTPQVRQSFVNFFRRAAAISQALYENNGQSPQVTFTLRPQTSDQLPEITVNIDGQTQTVTRTIAGTRSFVWDGTRAHDARISARLRGSDVTLLQAPPGPWALVRLLQQADWQRGSGGRWLLHWRVPTQGVDLAAEINFLNGAPVFMRDFIGGLTCVSEVAN